MDLALGHRWHGSRDSGSSRHLPRTDSSGNFRRNVLNSGSSGGRADSRDGGGAMSLVVSAEKAVTVLRVTDEVLNEKSLRAALRVLDRAGHLRRPPRPGRGQAADRRRSRPAR